MRRTLANTALITVILAACSIIVTLALTGPTRAIQAAPAPAPAIVDAPGDVIVGDATWYQTRAGNAAAGPGLRHLIGSAWRGTSVDVCRSGKTWVSCVRVRLTDWCACKGDRIIDLSSTDFSSLAPLSVGVIRVKIAVGAPPRETITQPPTDTVP